MLLETLEVIFTFSSLNKFRVGFWKQSRNFNSDYYMTNLFKTDILVSTMDIESFPYPIDIPLPICLFKCNIIHTKCKQEFKCI